MPRVTQALSANTSEIFFLSHLFQEIPGLVRLTSNPSRKSIYWEAYYFYTSIYLPKDLLKKQRSHCEVFLVCATHSSCIHLQWPSSLFRHTQSFSQNTFYLRKQTARQKRKTDCQCCLCSRAALNEFPKILNPQIKALIATLSPKTFRETNVWWPNGYKHKELKVRLSLK